VLVENIPDELKRSKRWVTWRYTWDGSKWTKPLFHPDGYQASHSDPKTWSTFGAVHTAYEDPAGDWDGIGIVLTLDDSLVGVDLDHCRNPETGALLSHARHFIVTLDSYTEISPSGTGIRILVRGVLPTGGRRSDELGIEFYDDARYLTITGQVYDG
jgi:primase-polymerase (primpol)-like protein